MRAFLLAAVLPLALTGCSCGGGKTNTSAGELKVQESNVDFGEVCAKPSAADIDLDSSSRSVHLINDGTALVYVNGFAITPDSAAALFTYDQATVPGSLTAGATAEVVIHFTPIASGATTGTLTVTGEDKDHPVVVTLVGTGSATPPDPALSMNCPGGFWNNDTCAPTSTSVAPMIFFPQTITGASADMKLTFHNGGCAPMKVTSIAVTTASDPSLGTFILTDPTQTSLTVPKAGSADLSVRFSPLSGDMPSAGYLNGALAFATNDPTHHQESLALQGIGVVPQLQLTPAECLFESLATPCDGLFQLSNNGDTDLVVHGVSVQAPNPMFTVSQAPAAETTLKAGDTAPVKVDYTPGATHTEDALLVDWSGGKLSARLSGGSPPVLALDPATELYFGDALAPGTEVYKPVTFTNVTSYAQQLPLTLISLQVVQTSGAFDLSADPANSTTCPAPPAADTKVAPGGSALACVHFKAGTGIPEYKDQLSITTDDPSLPQASLTLHAFGTCHNAPVAGITAPTGVTCPCATDGGLAQACVANECQWTGMTAVHVDDLTAVLSGEASYEMVASTQGGPCTTQSTTAITAWEWSLISVPATSKRCAAGDAGVNQSCLAPNGKGTAARTTLSWDAEGTFQVGLVTYDASGLASPPTTFNVYVGP